MTAVLCALVVGVLLGVAGGRVAGAVSRARLAARNVNVVAGHVLPMPDDPRWSTTLEDCRDMRCPVTPCPLMKLGEVAVWHNRVHVGNVRLDGADQYAAAVQRAYVDRLAMRAIEGSK